MRQLWQDLASNSDVTKKVKVQKGETVDVGFVNQYSLHNFIPNKWFDWESRVEAEVMIIGQDWGPYTALKKYVDQYELEKDLPNFDYHEFLFRTASSRTEKFIINSLSKTYLDKYKCSIDRDVWQNIFYTVAVMFTRQGSRFRGSEFYDEKFGIDASLPYLKRQIEIVQPKIIVPLGGTAWGMVRNIFNLNSYPDKISPLINSLAKAEKRIETANCTIIPNFHPASHTDPKVQVEIWREVWEVLSTKQ